MNMSFNWNFSRFNSGVIEQIFKLLSDIPVQFFYFHLVLKEIILAVVKKPLYILNFQGFFFFFFVVVK